MLIQYRQPIATTSAVGGNVRGSRGSRDVLVKVCRPDCQPNTVRHASFRLEQEAAVTIEELELVEELREAWIIYYAYW